MATLLSIAVLLIARCRTVQLLHSKPSHIANKDFPVAEANKAPQNEMDKISGASSSSQAVHKNVIMQRSSCTLDVVETQESEKLRDFPKQTLKTAKEIDKTLECVAANSEDEETITLLTTAKAAHCENLAEHHHQDGDDLTSYLYDTKPTSVHVLSFPKEHCWSVATGFIEGSNGNGIFVKDRHTKEVKVQVVCSLLGHSMGKFFGDIQFVPSIQMIQRPVLRNLHPGTAGYTLWKKKEQTWESVYGRKRRQKQRKRRPSQYECWQLETAVRFYNDDDKSNDIAIPSGEAEDINNASIDASLRRKLRRAADRSKSGCLDLMTLLLLTQCTQEQLHSEDWGKDYVKYSLLDDADSDGLNAAETNLLLREKLAGFNIQISLLFAATVALMDCNLENIAVREVVVDGGSSWRLTLVHFDMGMPPTHAGVGLTNLDMLHEEDDTDYDFDGDPNCTGYYMPFPLLFPVCDKPLCREALQGLKNIDGSQLQAIVEEEFKNFEYPLAQTGEYIKTRVETMQEFVTSQPKAPLREIFFRAVPAWKRDWEKYNEESFCGEWLYDMLEWFEEEEEEG